MGVSIPNGNETCFHQMVLYLLLDYPQWESVPPGCGGCLSFGTRLEKFRLHYYTKWGEA